MSKVRTLTQLQDELDKEISWRRKEIAGLKLSVRGAGALTEATLIRAGITLLYAHWEGFIKNASLLYLNYVNNQGLKYNELKSCFVVFGIKGHLNTLVQSKKTRNNVDAIDFIFSELNKPAKMSLASAIDTEANLSSKVFNNIISSLAFSSAPYEARYNLIDESLVDRRNKIAHGEFLDLNATDWRKLADEILSLMNMYKTEIENSASLAEFKRA
ncbi:MAE_28990/MAE_18760 family HEPN-like nuclease [Bradyrhizobium sp. SYSU BS000235]|uniref:MAE_28990/MAE_18760 family HEPN-like nuclease n=1 Tax=Bradyrhizobium sp. SYSU BS000235 TaxID=3411332 RepID=UPI003C757A8B